MHNSRPARPFEPLVRFLDLPRAGSFDPTLLMALFLPLMFGVMVGDVGYGAVLLVLGLVARRMLAARGSCAGRRHLGADWRVRRGRSSSGSCSASSSATWARGSSATGRCGRTGSPRTRSSRCCCSPWRSARPMWCSGLLLGAWQAARFRERPELSTSSAACSSSGPVRPRRLGRGPTVLRCADAVGGGDGRRTRARDGARHGALGLITGPLELLGRVGNVLSYLRLAAVGLASAHLASVANELATVGPIWLGVIVAAFFHALNLALASFSPMIQALRLHYVEFFGTFLIGGGRAFTPFGHVPERETSSTT